MLLEAYIHRAIQLQVNNQFAERFVFMEISVCRFCIYSRFAILHIAVLWALQNISVYKE